jgi:2,3-bisphosphoglycerate-independent phosphoglycerate mutase
VAIEAAYARGETDEFVAPTVIDGHEGPLRDHDAIVHLNFRADRARQLTHALADGPEFDGFDRRSPSGRSAPGDLLVVTMTEYEEGLPVLVAFPPETARSLAQAFSEAGWRQAHIAETEKYAHVTYFFNGGIETPWPGEDRVLVPSPKVATYDLQPSMSAAGVTDALVDAVASGRYDFIVANYANPDMVGHTGVWDATIQALTTIDGCLARVVAAVEAVEAADPAGPGAALAITADHGNADDLRDAIGAPVTAHSLNPVPLVLIGRSVAGRSLDDGVLADVAPTLLALAGLPPWPDITGRSLLRS